MLKFRPVKADDIKEISGWISNEEEFFYWSKGKLGTYPATEEDYRGFFVKASEAFKVFPFIAEAEDTVVGCVVLRSFAKTECVEISHVLVSPMVRGRGYGMAMIKVAARYSFEMLKAERVVIEAFVDNDAQFRMYAAVGFREDGVQTSYQFRGRNVFTKEMEMLSSSRDAVNSDSVIPEDDIIKEIIGRNKLRYEFQPIIDASTGDIFGYEALMRTSMDLQVSPVAILDYAKREGKLKDVEKLTFFNVMQFYQENRKLFGNRKLFINSIPGFQLSKRDYTEFQRRYKDCFENMVIEITEWTEFKDEDLADLLKRSVDDHFELAIDDYGTGYSNTSSLLTYTPSYLKIDRLLISDIHQETKKQHFVKSIVEFASANGIKTLAEGVENSAEMRTVIELGVDFIQGFYTARPSVHVLEAVDNGIRNEIITSSVKGTNQEVRKIYSLSGEAELPIMRLALEKYTGLVIDQPEFILVGNTGYTADMSIKIKDGTKCRLTIRNVFIESVDQLPCIELGKNCELTLVLEGENRMLRYGILVPGSSKLTIEGDGNLRIRAQGKSSYAIGSSWNAVVGDIKWKGKGSLDVLVEADEEIGIGGGSPGKGCGISLESGAVRIESASGRAISLGTVSGTPRIRIKGCKLRLDVKIDRGVGIGTIEGKLDTVITRADVSVICAGSFISAIGSVGVTSGHIRIVESTLDVQANGQKLYLMGAPEGDIDIDFKDSVVNFKGEGNAVLGLGTGDEGSCITAQKTSCNIRIASGFPVVYGAKNDKVSFAGGIQSVSVNE